MAFKSSSRYKLLAYVVFQKLKRINIES